MCHSRAVIQLGALPHVVSPAASAQAPLNLKIHSAKASDGTASHAVDGKPTTVWSTKKTASCFLSVQLEHPAALTSIKVAWRSPWSSVNTGSFDADVGAPSCSSCQSCTQTRLRSSGSASCR